MKLFLEHPVIHKEVHLTPTILTCQKLVLDERPETVEYGFLTSHNWGDQNLVMAFYCAR